MPRSLLTLSSSHAMCLRTFIAHHFNKMYRRTYLKPFKAGMYHVTRVEIKLLTIGRGNKSKVILSKKSNHFTLQQFWMCLYLTVPNSHGFFHLPHHVIKGIANTDIKIFSLIVVNDEFFAR